MQTQINQTTQQLEAATKSLDTFDKLEKQFGDVNGKASLQFRIYYTDGEQQVDLVRGNQAAELPTVKEDNIPKIDLSKEPK